MDFLESWLFKSAAILLWAAVIILTLFFGFLIITWAFISYDPWLQEWVSGNLFALFHLLWMVPLLVGGYIAAYRLGELAWEY